MPSLCNCIHHGRFFNNTIAITRTSRFGTNCGLLYICVFLCVCVPVSVWWYCLAITDHSFRVERCNFPPPIVMAFNLSGASVAHRLRSTWSWDIRRKGRKNVAPINDLRPGLLAQTWFNTTCLISICCLSFYEFLYCYNFDGLRWKLQMTKEAVCCKGPLEGEGSEKVWQFVTGEGPIACDVTLLKKIHTYET